MKKLMFFIIICFVNSCNKASLTESKNQFSWLAGKWKKISKNMNKITYESWRADRKTGDLLGKGFVIVNSDTVFSERLRILENKGEYFYSAKINQNKDAVLFKIKEYNSNSLLSENLEHDFPKRIEYKLSNDTLIAVISDDNKSIPLKFIREQ